MKILQMLAISILMIAAFQSFADGSPYLVDPMSGKFLGNLNSNRYDSDSVSNPYGRYGSKYSADSINNEYGQYGSRYGNSSVNNPYATGSPQIRH